MKIVCNIVTDTIRNLAKEIGKSSAYTCNLVSTWQTKNQSVEYPTASQLKELLAASKQEALDVYFAVPNYEVREYDPKIVPIEHVNDTVYLMKFSSDKPMDYFFKHFGNDKESELRKVIRNTKEAYQYILWREMSFIQRGLSKSMANKAIAEEEALKKAVEYAKRNPIINEKTSDSVNTETSITDNIINTADQVDSKIEDSAKVSDPNDLPDVGVEVLKVNATNPAAKLAKDFSAIERDDRVQMIAREFSNIIDRLLDKKIQDISQSINEEMAKASPNIELLQTLNEKAQLFNDSAKGRRAIMIEVGPLNIFSQLKSTYESYANMSVEEFEEDYGEGQGERMLEAYKKIVNNFDALLNEATVLIESAENIRLITEKHAYHNGNKQSDVLDAAIVDSTSDEDFKESELSDDEDGNRAEGNAGWSFKVRFVDPRTSLSKNTKKILSSIKKESSQNVAEVDDLGNIRYLSGDSAYNILMDGLSTMVDSDDFVIVNNGEYYFPALENLSVKYPWVKQVINTLKSNPSYISSFFADFRKDFIPYTIQYYDGTDNKWKDKQVNAPTALDSTRTEIVRNYEQGEILDEDSIYDNASSISKDNALKGERLTDSLLRTLQDSIDEEDEEAIVEDVTKGLRMLGLNTNSATINSLLSSEDGIINLRKVINAMRDIFSGVKNMDSESHLVTTFSGEYDTIASIVGEVSDLANVSSFRQGDKSYYSYSAPNYIDTVFKKFKNDAKRSQYLNDYFKKYNWFYSDGKWNSEWLNLIENDEDARYQMRLEDMNTINGVEYREWTPQMIKDTFIRKYFSAGYNKSSKKQFAWYNFPIFSDSPVAKFIKFIRYTDDYEHDITKLLSNVVKQELGRIKLVMDRDKVGASKIAAFDKNGTKFNFFPELNDIVIQGVPFLDLITEVVNIGDTDMIDVSIGVAIKELIDSNFLEFLSDYVMEDGKLTHRGKVLQQSLIDNNSISNEHEFINALREYFWNQAYATTQIIQIATTDLAFYKDDVDFQKRFKEVYAAGTKLNTNSQYGRKIEKTIYLADSEITSTGFNSVKKSLQEAVDAGHILKEDMDSILKNFKKVNVADAQAYRSLDSMRAILDMMGAWTPEMENTMNRFENGEWDMTDFNTIWQTIKPFVYTQIEKPDGLGGIIKVPHQNKNSEFLLLSMYNMVANALSSPKMKAINRFMKDNNIDVIQFESAVKAGKQGVIDINYSENKLNKWAEDNNKDGSKKPLSQQYKEEMDSKLDNGVISQEEYNKAIEDMAPDEQEVYEILSKYSKTNGEDNPEVVHKIPYEDYVIQQPTPEHLFDVDAVFGSQFRNLLISDMPDDPAFRVTVNDKQYTKKEVLDMYQAIIVENLLDDFDKVNSKFKDIHSLQKALLDNIKGNPKYGRDMVNALQIVTITNPITGEKEEVFNIPLNNPSTTLKIQELVTSMFKNGITKQQIKGGACILVSSFGYTDKLKTVHNEDGSIKYLECYLPAYSKQFFEPFMEERVNSAGKKYMELDVNRMPSELRKIIGYRIPTEDKYSMAPLFIKGFMPQQNGSAIMLPADTTIFSGEDYDVDKKFLMIPEFRVYTHNLSAARKEFERENNIINSIAEKFKDDSEAEALMLEDLTFSEWWKAKSQEEKDEFKYKVPKVAKVKYNKEAGPENNSRAARNNFLIDIAWGILTNKDTAEKIHNPGSFDKAKQSARISVIINDARMFDNYMLEYDLSSVEEAANKLLSSSLDELDAFVNKFKKVRSQLTLDTFIYNHKQNMTGGILIGMYANNTTMQAKFQATGLAIKDDETFFINDRKIKSLHDITSSTGERISKNCANFSAASVDNVKDPVLADLMQNTNTANVAGFMLRAGMSVQEVGLMFSQPIVRDCILNTGGLDKLPKFIKRSLSELRDNGGSVDLKHWQAYNLKSKDLIMNVLNSYAELSLMEYNESLVSNIMAANLMLHIVKIAKDLSGLTQIARADSPNGAIAISISGAKNQVQKVNNYKRRSRTKEFILTGLEGILENEFIRADMSKDELRQKLLKSSMPMLQAFYSLGIEMGTKIISPYFVQTTEYVDTLINELYNNHPLGILKDQQLNKFYSEMIEFGLSKTKLFGDDGKHTFDEKRDYYLYDYPQQFLAIKANNPDIANLNAIRKLEVVDGYIVMRNSGRLTPLMKDTLMRDFDTLLYMNNPAAQKLAVDLFMYAYYKDGFNFGPNNYGTFFSTAFLNSFPEFINALREMKFSMKEGTYFDRFLPQYYANHWSEDVLPIVNGLGTNYLKDGSVLMKADEVVNTNKVLNNTTQDVKSWKYIVIKDPISGNLVPYVLEGEGKELIHYVPMNTIKDAQGAKYNANMTAQEMAEIVEDPAKIKTAPKISSKFDDFSDSQDPFSGLEGMDVIMGANFDSALNALEDQYSIEVGQAQLDEPLC